MSEQDLGARGRGRSRNTLPFRSNFVLSARFLPISASFRAESRLPRRKSSSGDKENGRPPRTAASRPPRAVITAGSAGHHHLEPDERHLYRIAPVCHERQTPLELIDRQLMSDNLVHRQDALLQ